MKAGQIVTRTAIICAFSILGACEVNVDKDAAALAENQAAEFANQAEGLAEQAREEISGAAGIIEQQAGALQNELDEGEAPAENEAENAQ